MEMLIDVKRDRLLWEVKCGNEVTEKGVANTFEDAREAQKERCIQEVWIDEGYRTLEVRAAALLFGWTPVKGRYGVRGPWNEIQEAVGDILPNTATA